MTPLEVVKIIESGQRIFIQGGVATPQLLVDAMVARSNELKNVEIVHIHTEGKTPYLDPLYKDSFEVNSFFIGANARKAVNQGHAQYIPVFLSEIPALFRRGVLPLDVAMVQVSPPDKHGFCSLGVSVDISAAAVEQAKYVLAQINPNMPRTHGDGLVHISKIDAYCEVSEPLYVMALGEPTDVEKSIGQHISGLVEDGATLQMGARYQTHSQHILVQALVLFPTQHLPHLHCIEI